MDEESAEHEREGGGHEEVGKEGWLGRELECRLVKMWTAERHEQVARKGVGEVKACTEIKSVICPVMGLRYSCGYKSAGLP